IRSNAASWRCRKPCACALTNCSPMLKLPRDRLVDPLFPQPVALREPSCVEIRPSVVPRRYFDFPCSICVEVPCACGTSEHEGRECLRERGIESPVHACDRNLVAADLYPFHNLPAREARELLELFADNVVHPNDYRKRSP